MATKSGQPPAELLVQSMIWLRKGWVLTDFRLEEMKENEDCCGVRDTVARAGGEEVDAGLAIADRGEGKVPLSGGKRKEGEGKKNLKSTLTKIIGWEIKH